MPSLLKSNSEKDATINIYLQEVPLCYMVNKSNESRSEEDPYNIINRASFKRTRITDLFEKSDLHFRPTIF
ncbi:MAG: hypothetical protein ACM31M_07980 [Nitrososphaerota archaeon]|jgi:hypothetical protein